jgi:HK97 family phage major capsid protein
MKVSDELRQTLATAQAEAKALVNDDKATVEQINAKTNEINLIKAKLDAQLLVEEGEEPKISTEIPVEGADKPIDAKKLEVKVFAKALAGKPMEGEREIKALSSLTDANGKLLIPEDVQTSINTWLRNYNDMAQYASRETVNTISGSRVYEVEAESTPFAEVAELTTIPAIDEPTFQDIRYTCNYYKGMLKIPNELLKNETGGLMAYISQWIAKKMVASRNVLAFYADGTKAQGLLGVTDGGIVIHKDLTAPVTLDYIDNILNVSLPMAVSASAECRIYTNQTGFNYLLSLKDTTGKRYLQQDITNPAAYRYSGKEIVVFDDRQLKNETIATVSQFPVIIGNLQEAIKLFEHESFAIDTDRSIYFDEDATGMRVIGAMDTKLLDKKAAIAFYSPLVTIS